MARLDSLEPYLNRKTICIKDIDTSPSKEELKSLLLKVCPTGSGSIVVPVDKNTGYTLGQAYCNFDDKKEAKAALEKWRFTLKIRNKYVHMMYAVNMNMKNAKAKVFERPGCYKHFIVVKNISDQVDEVALYKAFVAYGEILQCFIDWDHYDQPFGHVQYIEESACIRAVERANGTGALGHNTIIQVQRHSRGLQQQPKQEEAPAVQSGNELPTLRGRASNSGSAGGRQLELDEDGFPIYDPSAFEDPAPANEQQHAVPKIDTDFGAGYEHRSQPGSSSQVTTAPASPPEQQPTPQPGPPPQVSAQQQQQQSFDDMPVPQLPSVDASGPAAFIGGQPPAAQHPNMQHLMQQMMQMQMQPQAANGPPMQPGMPPMPMQLTQQQMQAMQQGSMPGAPAAPFMGPMFHMMHQQQQQQYRLATPAAPSSQPAFAGSNMQHSQPPAGPQSQPEQAPTRQAARSKAMPGSPKHGQVAGRKGTGRQAQHQPMAKLLSQVMAQHERLVESLCCPITQEVFHFPVVAADGVTYERDAIEEWLTTHDTSPMTNDPLEHKLLFPNNLVKALVSEII